MKKRILGLVALLACTSCFAGCDSVNFEGVWDKVSGGFENVWDKVTDLIPGGEDEVTWNAEAAADMFYELNFEKYEETRNDYTVPNTYNFMKATYTVEWSVDVTTGVVIERGETETTVNVDEMLLEDLDYVLTAKFIAGDGTFAEISFERTVLAMASTVAAPITTAPVEGVMYKYYVYQAGAQKDCYFTGAMDGFYFKTSTKFEDAVDVYVEYVEGSTTEFYPCFNHPDDGTKQYIGVKVSDDGQHNNIVFDEAPVSTFVWNATLGTITTTILDKDGNMSEFYLGNYTKDGTKHYTTVSASTIDNAESSNVGHLVGLVSVDTVAPAEKLAQAKRNFSVSSFYFGTGTAELPTANEIFPDVTMTYAIADSTVASVSGNVLTYTAVAADTEVTMMVTFSCGNETPVTKEVTFTVSPIPTVPAAGELTIVEALALDLVAYGNGYNGGKTTEIYTISGIVTSIKSDWNPQYNNMDVYISDDVNGTNSILVYRLGTQVELGDVITVTGKLGYYNKAVQVAQGATAEITGKETLPGGEPTIPDTWPVLEENTAYKFYVAPVTLDNVPYYFNGEIKSSRYLNTTTNPYDAVDVYVEKSTTAVGYSFYFMVGETKNYINITLNSDNKTCATFVTENPAVYSYNEAGKAWYTNVNGKDYYFGTYDSKGTTYTTLSASELKYVTAENTGVTQFPATFILASETEWSDAEKLAFEKDALTVETSVVGDKTITLPATGKDFENVAITWTVSESAYATYADGVLTLTQPILTDATVTLTASIVCGDETDSKTFEITLIAGDPVYPDTWPQLQEGTAYRYFVEQKNIGATYYFNGKISGKYLSSTVYASEAADVYVEKAATGYSFYFMNGSTKTYINLSTTEKAVVLATENPTVYAYNPETKAWWAKAGSLECYIGTYNSYNTFSASETSYIKAENTGKTQFPAQFTVAADVADVTEAAQIAFELDKITVAAEVTGANEITLTNKASIYSKVSIAWSLAANDCATLNGNKLTITNPAQDTTITLTATVTCGTVTEEKDFVIAVKYSNPATPTTTASVKISEYASANGWKNSTKYTTIKIDDNISVQAKGGSNTGKYYTSGTNWRIYQSENPTVTITAVSGKTIVSVKITYASEKSGVLTLNGSQIKSNTVVTVNANSVSFGVGNTGTETGGQARITAIEVIYK